MRTHRRARLFNLDHQGKRGSVERALKLWCDRGVFLDAEEEYEGAGRYRVVTGNNTEWRNLTLKEAQLLCHGAASAWLRYQRFAPYAEGLPE